MGILSFRFHGFVGFFVFRLLGRQVCFWCLNEHHVIPVFFCFVFVSKWLCRRWCAFDVHWTRQLVVRMGRHHTDIDIIVLFDFLIWIFFDLALISLSNDRYCIEIVLIFFGFFLGEGGGEIGSDHADWSKILSKTDKLFRLCFCLYPYCRGFWLRQPINMLWS